MNTTSKLGVALITPVVRFVSFGWNYTIYTDISIRAAHNPISHITQRDSKTPIYNKEQEQRKPIKIKGIWI